MTEAEARELKAKLEATARERWPNDPDRQKVYVFGTLRKQGWKPKREA